MKGAIMTKTEETSAVETISETPDEIATETVSPEVTTEISEHEAFVAEIRNKIALYEQELETADFDRGISIRAEIDGLKKQL
jgi:hypothetical protein